MTGVIIEREYTLDYGYGMVGSYLFLSVVIDVRFAEDHARCHRVGGALNSTGLDLTGAAGILPNGVKKWKGDFMSDRLILGAEQ